MKKTLSLVLTTLILGTGIAMAEQKIAVIDVQAVITKYDGELRVNDDESKKFDWFSINDLPKNMTQHTINYIEKFGNTLGDALEALKNS